LPAQGAPPVAGAAFLANQQGRSLGDLFTLIRTTMPPGGGGSLSDAEYLAAMAYILEANEVSAGEQDLEPDLAVLRDIGF
jgi:alcohol dehydrogenase (cytochrome c)